MALRETAERLRYIRSVVEKSDIADSLVSFRSKSNLLDPKDLILLKQQALELGSLQLHLALVAYQVATLDSTQPAEYAELINSCLILSRFRDIIQLQKLFRSTDADILSAELQAYYRLADWKHVIGLADVIPSSRSDFLLQSFYIRSLIEVGQTSHALKSLKLLIPCSPQEADRKQLLELLCALRAGRATKTEIDQLLFSLDHQSNTELAIFLSHLPLAACYLSLAEVREKLLPASHSAWQKLSASPISIMTAAHDNSRKQLQSICISHLQLSLSSLYFADSLSAAIKEVNPRVSVIHLALSADASISALHRDDLIIFDRATSSELIDALRQLSCDVLVDRIGLRDPRWLLAVSQRIFPLQLLWAEAPTAYLPADGPYAAQLVDRWTGADLANFPNMLSSAVLTCSRSLATRQHPAVDNSLLLNQEAISESPGLLVLGSPDKMLPGAATLLDTLIQQTPAQQILMTDPAFESNSILHDWWSYWNSHDDMVNPYSCYRDIRELTSQPVKQLIAVDLCIESPCDMVIQCLMHGIPVAHLTSNCMGSSGTASILSAIGLGGFSISNPKEMINIINILLDDPESYDDVSRAILTNLPESLLFDYKQFAIDLLEAIYAL